MQSITFHANIQIQHLLKLNAFCVRIGIMLSSNSNTTLVKVKSKWFGRMCEYGFIFKYNTC